MHNLIELVNQNLLLYTETINSDELREAISYSLFPSGKRLRPLILLTILDDLGISLSSGINAATAIEMIHSYSLIHDDLPAMDNDDFRRGKPSSHMQFGEALAILAADALLTDAFLYFSNNNVANEVNLKLVQHAVKFAGSNGMIKGQVLDMNANSKELSLEEIKEIHLHKTKDLILLAIICAKELSNLGDEYLEKLEELAHYFGLAFQIKDDIEDYYTEQDLLADKASYVKVVGLEESKRLLIEYHNNTLEIAKEIFGEKKFFNLISEVLK